MSFFMAQRSYVPQYHAQSVMIEIKAINIPSLSCNLQSNIGVSVEVLMRVAMKP